jgi:sigma-E factor negative regulatory protein RseA
MTDPVKEQLSACLDGELPEGELDLLLKQLARDPQLRQTMGSYARIGEVMRAERAVTASAGFAAKVCAAIAAEPQSESQSVVARPPKVAAAAVQWLRPVVGLAIAAGVAAVAVFAVQPDATQPAQVARTVEQGTVALPTSTLSQSSYTVPTNTASTAFIPATRLTNYVVAHSEYSSPLGRRTVLSGVLSDENGQEELPAQGDVAVGGPNDGPIDVTVESSTDPVSPRR